ncbi:peptidoglycan DD-metalloendopeptidase family protein [Defluviimonas sp. WL0050]|uniref:Peptidoglycan DD-metalloendopeptidase family protein n=1 Tax=Albidovulum litorale TaxID=2984134 RepID=A0ABT2ZPI7_9RHOB|nr:peptidoglycan DD-metalloendopeptidase family protein [Defluviimonas sp. WL0050]MCV2872671.1 peptidoglycan DD-metalloendopeptidase family protein [Defluviimonas sp. WL0050]
MILRPALVALCLGLAPAWAAEDPAIADAGQAAAALRDAIATLDTAGGGRDRVAALTRTIRAYETGLAGLRDADRRTRAREEEILADMAANRTRIGGLLAALAEIERAKEPLLLVHPDGPVATARAAMVLSSVTPALEAEAEALGTRLEELQHLRALEARTASVLKEGLTAAQEARAALSKAIQDRTDLPQRFLEDPEELTLLVASAESLDVFAASLSQMETDIGAPMEDFAGAMGTLPLPVQGWVLRRPGEADAAGIIRPGLVIATDPGALVTLPWPATIRYRGPLLDYGNVMIVEPASGYLLILAGLGTVFGETGDVLEAGAPVGFMGDRSTGAAANLAQDQEGGGAARAETLYIELRQGKEPVDPAPWFIETRED